MLQLGCSPPLKSEVTIRYCSLFVSTRLQNKGTWENILSSVPFRQVLGVNSNIQPFFGLILDFKNQMTNIVSAETSQRWMPKLMVRGHTTPGNQAQQYSDQPARL